MKQYAYSGKSGQEILRWQLAGCLGFAGFLPAILINVFLIVYSAIYSAPDASGKEIRATLLFWIILLLFAGFSGSSILINKYPIIWVSDEAIYISYFFIFRLRIPWDQLLEIKNIRLSPRIVLVVARRITPWHIHYSVYNAFCFKPGFLIKDSINDFDELVRTLRRNIRNA